MKIDIVGGSLAGLSTALSIKENNKKINVIVHEKHKKIGYNSEGRRCGEAHTIEKQWKKWKPEGKSIFNVISKGDVTVGEKNYLFPRKPETAFILNRQEFIYQLAKKAEKEGVILQKNDKIKSYKDLDGEYIVDASGCPSVIKRELGFNSGIKNVTYQQTIEDSNCFVGDTIKVIYFDLLSYIWIFPRNPDKKEINLGVGTFGNFKYNLKEIIEDFKKENNIQGKVNYVLGGLIPIGLQRPFKYKNILFVGDASIGTFIFTGQGIYRSLLSGDIAGWCIAKGQASRYPRIINNEFIKWDLIGKTYIWYNYVFRKINPELVLKSLNYYAKIYGPPH